MSLYWTPSPNQRDLSSRVCRPLQPILRLRLGQGPLDRYLKRLTVNDNSVVEDKPTKDD